MAISTANSLQIHKIAGHPKSIYKGGLFSNSWTWPLFKPGALSIAGDVAPNVQLAKSIFPNVQIGDVEVVYFSKDFVHATEEWVIADLKRRKLDLTVEMGMFVRDACELPQKGSAESCSAFAGAGGQASVRQSHQGWLESAVQNFTRIEKQMGVDPDQAIFHARDKFPIHSISDPSGPGEDYLVKRYLQQHGVSVTLKPKETCK